MHWFESDYFLLTRALSCLASCLGIGQASRGRGRGGLHQRGQELRHHFEVGSVVHDHAPQNQETNPGRGRALLKTNANIIIIIIINITLNNYNNYISL